MSDDTDRCAGCMGASMFMVASILAKPSGSATSCVIPYNEDPTCVKDTCTGDRAATNKVGETTFEASCAAAEKCIGDEKEAETLSARLERGRCAEC